MILHFVLSIYHIPINYFQASLKWKDWVIKFIFIKTSNIGEMVWFHGSKIIAYLHFFRY